MCCALLQQSQCSDLQTTAERSPKLEQAC